jgi:hypothetical protein
MTASSKSSRFPAQFIPSFLALEPTEPLPLQANIPTPDLELPVPTIARRQQVDARLELIDREDGKCHFILHSRMNARILTGTICLNSEVGVQRSDVMRRFLTQCTQESAFELVHVEGGLIWSLLPSASGAQGHSDKIGDEALARATLRLITGQAARALRSFELQG